MTGHKPFSKLVESMSPEAQARVAATADKLRAEMPLHELRSALELSQTHLAELLNVDQPAISKMERRTDMMLSTLRRFIEAMGGELDIRAVFPDGEVRIRALGEVRANQNSQSRMEREPA
jgi:transcriptional regulator with XRE-family HTH domain